MIFKGKDYKELAQHFNVELSDDDNIKPLREFLDDKCNLIYCSPYVVKTCRNFLFALKQASKYEYDFPIWNGLSKIEDDHTFMKYFSELIGYMWI